MEALKSQSVTQSKAALEFVLGMKGGNGDSSYANNSSPQLKIIQAVKPILEHGIYENMRFKFDVGGIFRMADFGCGTGQNTLVVADTIVSAVQRLLTEQEMPEFEVYFTDLPTNDFNSLFQMLPPPRDKNGVATRSYLSAAVCGSHFTRLFARNSLHFCHSSMSLHWLSQVPESVQQRRSPRAYVSSECEEGVAAAYLHQFDTNFSSFLKARAEEIVEGGCMFISLIGRNADTHIMEDQGVLGYSARHLEYAFEALVMEGIITKEKWESFNLPWFNPNLKEVESIVKREGSFAIVSMKIVGGMNAHPTTDVKKGEENMFGRIVANQHRALFENIVEAHLGCKKVTNEFFLKIAERASIQFEEYLSKKIELLVAFLKKKKDKQ
ncbi:hypothetical protein SUGI_0553770 [Cryptomeria japonica]|uniref:indole-3-acetate O-methyltransferase 1-like n=1 Tax=Cryptomeria japonica TaxID=3369 RepID=UPI002408DE28|nr:indole-3-acetate O-methyltransferase 1-like [Cryptomeria japonica]GLJ28193.1 hypothetical protein SUGI_0553770 [Cryptomeria japonica]